MDLVIAAAMISRRRSARPDARGEAWGPAAPPVGAAEVWVLGGALAAGVGRELDSAGMSASTIAPCGPLPERRDKSRPRSAASRRANGVALIRSARVPCRADPAPPLASSARGVGRASGPGSGGESASAARVISVGSGSAGRVSGCSEEEGLAAEPAPEETSRAIGSPTAIVCPGSISSASIVPDS